MLDAGSISTVLAALRPERAALLELLRSLSRDDWSRPTECPAYPVHGIASHILGDDLSLLSRQRDGGINGLLLMAETMPGSDFRTLLDAFNDQWVEATRFLSRDLLLTLLGLAGEWTADYYATVDPDVPGEPVGFFGDRGPSSPFWKAIAREYVERWVHHSQIRRALGLGSVDDLTLMRPGVEVIASAIGVEAGVPAAADGTWSLAGVDLGQSQQAATILTRGLSASELGVLRRGPGDAEAFIAALTGRP
jgi:uncharacterized protein (TIGR03083 family)